MTTDCSKTIIFDRIAVTRRLLDDEDMLRIVAECFLEDMAIQLKDIAAAIDEQEPNAIAQHAHKIKGSCANMGALQMSCLAQEIESSAKVSTFNQIDAQLATLSMGFKTYELELKAALF